MQTFFSNHTFIKGDFSINEVEIVDQVGKGNARVFTAFVRGEFKAIKEIEIRSDRENENFLKEISLMEDLSNTTPCMIKYQGYFLTEFKLNQYNKKKIAFIVMECAKMNLYDFIRHQREEKKIIPQKQIEDILEFLLKSFSQLEKVNIAHCDIKPENILVMNTDKLELKLCDAGSCKIFNTDLIEEATIHGTVPFLAPELIKAKSSKIISANAFKSDVFSFGLVFLYVVTGKKFTGKQRMEINEKTYREVIQEWIFEATERTNQDQKVREILQAALTIDEKNRPLFKNLKMTFDSFKRKSKLVEESRRRKLSSEEQNTMEAINRFTNKFSELSSVRSTVNHMTNTKLKKIVRLQTKVSGTSIQKHSRYISKKISPNKSNTSFVSSFSPQKLHSLMKISKIIHVTNQNRHLIQYDKFTHEEKTFVLHTDSVNFKAADKVSVFQSCPLSVIYALSQVKGNRLFLEYKGIQGVGLGEDVPILDFKQININLEDSVLAGGYAQLFMAISSFSLQKLKLRLSCSEVSLKECNNLLDRLKNRQIKELSLSWEKNELQPKNHSEILQKISKLPLKKCELNLNQCYIKYSTLSRWPLPKTCQSLHLSYRHNFMGSIIDNFCLSLTKLPLKWLSLNLQNNNLQKSAVNAIFKTIFELPRLEKFFFNFSMNAIHDVEYISEVLLKGKRIKNLQLRMHKCGITLQSFSHFLKMVSSTFTEDQQVMKLTYDRKIRKEQFLAYVEECFEAVENIKINVIGYDTKYYFIVIKRERKMIQKSIVIKKQKSNHFLIKVNKVKKEAEKKKEEICYFQYSNNESLENFLCLTCCQTKQMAKYLYYCKYCIDNCEHKGHNVVKTFEKKPCSCAFNRCSAGTQEICAEFMNIVYKREYRCLKCRQKYCEFCVKNCQQNHQTWVQRLGSVSFICGTPL